MDEHGRDAEKQPDDTAGERQNDTASERQTNVNQAGPNAPDERRRKRVFSNAGGRRAGLIAAGVLTLMLVGFFALWLRCGLHGCPDVEMLKGYMPDQASSLVDRNGQEIAKLFVTRRVVVPIDSIPEHTQNAFVAIEDKRFWDHGGVDWRRVLGALAANVKSGEIEEGSSTITMQLARNVFPDKLPANQKTIWRKLGEARVAGQIEQHYEKPEIMELYLNQIYFGSGAYGIQAAAEEYFGKSAADLDLPESAMLAALPRAPSRLNPRANREAALEGRALVLRRMADQGMITAEEQAEAEAEELVLEERQTKSTDQAPYFVEAVRRQLEDQLGSALYTEGYTIHTTLDLESQRVAEKELAEQLRAIESGRFGGYPHPTYAGVQADTTRDPTEGTPYLQGAMIVMDAQTGDVLALIGGRDFEDSEYNRATQAMRQPGSAFKPFVYAAALNAGYSPAHRLMDRPLRYVMDDGRVWEPGNYDGSFSGVVTMRQALTYSKNVPTVRLANEVGLSRVVGMAEQFGLGPIDSHPAVVLGTSEVTPLQLTSAYAAFATLGQRPEPRLVTRVVNREGEVVWSQQPEAQQVVDPAVAFITTSLMQDVVDRGTGAGVRGAGYRGAAAGKTGTTQDASDVWFVGFTPELVGTIWIGLDKRQRILRGATGGEIAAPVWGRVMRQIAPGTDGWSVPSGVEQLQVDESGTVLASNCPATGALRNEYFIRGTAPSASCYQADVYAYSDTFDWESYGYDQLQDTTAAGQTTDDMGWWDRLRSRIGGGDSAAVVVPPVGQPPVATPPVDSASRRGQQPLGRPVTPRPAPRDTVRIPPVTRPRPDTTRPPPPDTTHRPPPPDTSRRPPPPDTSAVR